MWVLFTLNINHCYQGKIFIYNYTCYFLFVDTQLSPATYLRFSTLPIEDIQRRLYLVSERFVFAMFESMVIHIIASFPGRFQAAEKRPCIDCSRMRQIPHYLWGIGYLHALLVYFCYMLPCTFGYSSNIAASTVVTSCRY